jgi:hypothetical protein
MEEFERRHRERIEEQIAKIPVIEVKVEMLVDQLEKIANKFESSIDKLQVMIAALTVTFTQQLFDHSSRDEELNRIRDTAAEDRRKEQEGEMQKRHEELKNEIAKHNDDTENRIRTLEHKQWWLSGVGAAIGSVATLIAKYITNS